MPYQKRSVRRRWPKAFLSFCIISLMFYGVGRLYYHFTDGFAISNITSTLPYDARWETRALTLEEKRDLDTLLSQPYRYLGKGCQSYVFGSEDGKYVIKFFKYQRFRPQFWLRYLSFIPGVERYRLRKLHKKNCKLEGVFESWRLAFNELQEESGLVYVHLNKTKELRKPLVLYDKMGWRHELDLDGIEFLVQKRAHMLCDEIESLMVTDQLSQAKTLLKTLVNQVLSEYHRGLADNDHALMQNTGVYEGHPIHIDVGQFVNNEKVKSPKFHMQELYTKTFKFRIWLQKRYPSLSTFFDDYLQELYGDEFETMKPKWRKKIEIFQ